MNENNFQMYFIRAENALIWIINDVRFGVIWNDLKFAIGKWDIFVWQITLNNIWKVI